jgi:hypothetical protein
MVAAFTSLNAELSMGGPRDEDNAVASLNAPAGCRVPSPCTAYATLPLDAPLPLNAPIVASPLIAPSPPLIISVRPCLSMRHLHLPPPVCLSFALASCCVTSHCAAFTTHPLSARSLSTRRLVVELPLVVPPLSLILLMCPQLSMRRLVVALPLIAPPPPLVLLAHPCLSMHRLHHSSSQCAATSQRTGWLSHCSLSRRLCHSSSQCANASNALAGCHVASCCAAFATHPPNALPPHNALAPFRPTPTPPLMLLALLPPPPPPIRNSTCMPWMLHVLSFPSAIASSVSLNLITW